ncbi:hypothetical protein [Neptunomonas sp. XY-337]|uniref:hypothetical protein n=1 Tax=Neptunomonas sp. XY-337 TaxID=2561897 RepID=UPI0010AA8BD7|nr:hypothetical protein [Neptunomonas sp. XY-337]
MKKLSSMLIVFSMLLLVGCNATNGVKSSYKPALAELPPPLHDYLETPEQFTNIQPTQFKKAVAFVSDEKLGQTALINLRAEDRGASIFYSILMDMGSENLSFDAFLSKSGFDTDISSIKVNDVYATSIKKQGHDIKYLQLAVEQVLSVIVDPALLNRPLLAGNTIRKDISSDIHEIMQSLLNDMDLNPRSDDLHIEESIYTLKFVGLTEMNKRRAAVFKMSLSAAGSLSDITFSTTRAGFTYIDLRTGIVLASIVESYPHFNGQSNGVTRTKYEVVRLVD